MNAIELRISETAGFPLPYSEIALTPDECSDVVRAFRSLSQDSNWVPVDNWSDSNSSPDETRRWLAALPIQGVVKVAWLGCGAGIRIDFPTFVQFYDDLWYPSSDDVWMISEDRCNALEMSHEEEFTWFEKITWNRSTYDDDREMTNYVLHNYAQLMTPQEGKVFQAVLAEEKAANASESMAKELRERWGAANDPWVVEILHRGVDEFFRGVRDRILEQHAEVVISLCPRCSRVVATPKAQQCLWCGYDWHPPA